MHDYIAQKSLLPIHSCFTSTTFKHYHIIPFTYLLSYNIQPQSEIHTYNLDVPWGIDLDKCTTRYSKIVEPMSPVPSLPLIGSSESAVLDTLAIKPEVIQTSGGRVTITIPFECQAGRDWGSNDKIDCQHTSSDIHTILNIQYLEDLGEQTLTNA